VHEAKVERLRVGEDVTEKSIAALKRHVYCLSRAVFYFMLCRECAYRGRAKKISSAHSYEEPAYGVFRPEDF